MGWPGTLFGRREATGTIYRMKSVDPNLGEFAETAIAASRYKVFATLGDNRSVLMIKTDPPLVALIERQSNGLGHVPDMIIQQVFLATGNGERLASRLPIKINGSNRYIGPNKMMGTFRHVRCRSEA